MKRIAVLGALVFAGTLTVVVAAKQQPAPPSVDGLTVEKVKDNLWVIRSATGFNSGGNTAVFATAKGLTVVDTKSPGWGQPLLDKIKTLSDKPITTIINTHTHYDHVSGNVVVPATVEIIAHENTAKRCRRSRPSITGIGKTENVFKAQPREGPGQAHVQGQDDDSAQAPIRSTCTTSDPAHTGGDAFVEFPALHVLHVGDIFFNKGLPIMDGGQRRLRRAVRRHGQEGDQRREGHRHHHQRTHARRNDTGRHARIRRLHTRFRRTTCRRRRRPARPRQQAPRSGRRRRSTRTTAAPDAAQATAYVAGDLQRDEMTGRQASRASRPSGNSLLARLTR